VDELGDTRWDNYTVFNNDNHNRGTELRLIAALKEAQREQRGDVIEKVAAYIHRSAEAVEDPGTRAALVALADGVLEGRAFQ
jgi:L-lactate utilization protein LutB